MEYKTIDEFFEDLIEDYALVEDAQKRFWLVHEDEDGDRWAVRARTRDDTPWGGAPIFSSVEKLPFPVRAMAAREAFDLQERLEAAEKRAKDLSWRVNPDRMGS